MLLRDVKADRAALAFWGVVSGAVPLHKAMGFPREHVHVSSIARSIGPVLNQLVSAGILDGRTIQPPFDANRRCRDCGAIHADSPLLRRLGPDACFATLWGGPPALNTAGLRQKGRR
jgi:hypothetical protein